MKHRSCAAFLRNTHMEQTLIRRLALVNTHEARTIIHNNHLLAAQLTFINTACGYRESQRLTLHHGTEVPTGPHQPPALIESPRNGNNPPPNLINTLIHAAQDAPKPSARASPS